MRLPFHEFHLMRLLENYSSQSIPLDLCMNHYFRQNKALGSKDKKFISEAAYGMSRWLELLDALNDGETSWSERYRVYSKLEEYRHKIDKLPDNVQVACPQLLWDWLRESFSVEQCKELCLINNQQAPTTVRANLLRTTRDKLLEKWGDICEPCEESACGIRFRKRMNFFQLPEFKEGCFEVQDEASQLVADLVRCEPGDRVMDFCSGSGGKTLAFAPKMKEKGQIYLHDVRPRTLQEARKRLKRAGIQNAQTLQSGSPALKPLKNKMDWVLVDAPCSGTGTLRRNPDMKWRYDEEMLDRLRGLQRNIFERALSYVRPGGYIVYATCSVLLAENQEQMQHFLNTYPIDLEGPPFVSLPTEGGMDGFFGVVFSKKREAEVSRGEMRELDFKAE